jgi:hypothetical protein
MATLAEIGKRFVFPKGKISDGSGYAIDFSFEDYLLIRAFTKYEEVFACWDHPNLSPRFRPFSSSNTTDPAAGSTTPASPA